MRLGWLNPRLGSNNLGDIIIEDAIRHELSGMLDDSIEVVQLPTQTFLSREQRRIAASCDTFVVGGTNLLNGNIPRYIQWRLDPHSFGIYAGKTNLMGVGWWQYQRTNGISREVWSRLLRGRVHSVRDGYTARKLRALGVEAINTGCPTMWPLPANLEFTRSSSTVISTVTDYHKNHERDRKMLVALGQHYDRVLVWLQGTQDRKYLSELDVEVEYIEPSVHAFNEVLSAGGVDYFGTRLHAGVRALQRGVRATIVVVDNRAREIARDTGLPVLDATPTNESIEDSANIARLELRLPEERIANWKKQFCDLARGA